MLKLTLAASTKWSTDGSVFINPRAIAAMVRCLPDDTYKVEYTLVTLLVPGDDDGPAAYPVTETPDEIADRIEVLK